MTERAKTGALDTSAWAEAQQNYWNVWTDLALQALTQTGRDPEGVTTWPEALQRWWEAVAPHYSQADSELLKRLISQGQGYLMLGEQALHFIATLQEAVQNGKDWRAALKHGIDNIRRNFFEPFRARDENHAGLAALWGLPIETWQGISSSLRPFPGDASPAGHPLRLSQERQEQRQQDARLWLDYQEVHREYVKLLHRAADRSLDLLHDRLSERMEADEALKSLREIYNLWVNCSEEAYTEIARSPDYSEVKGRLINALMRCKRHEQRSVDERLSALSIPTRAELNKTNARLQDTRRRLGHLEDSKGKPRA